MENPKIALFRVSEGKEEYSVVAFVRGETPNGYAISNTSRSAMVILAKSNIVEMEYLKGNENE